MSGVNINPILNDLIRSATEMFEWDKKENAWRCNQCPESDVPVRFNNHLALKKHIKKHKGICAQGCEFDWGKTPGTLFRFQSNGPDINCRVCGLILENSKDSLLKHALDEHGDVGVGPWLIEPYLKKANVDKNNSHLKIDGQAMVRDLHGYAHVDEHSMATRHGANATNDNVKEGYFGIPVNVNCPDPRSESEQLGFSLPISPACVSSPEARKDEAFSDAPSSSPCKKTLFSRPNFTRNNFNRIASCDNLAQLLRSSDNSDDNDLADKLDTSSSSALNITSSSIPRSAGLEESNLKNDSNAEFEQPLQPRTPLSVIANGQDRQSTSSVKRKPALPAHIVATGAALNEKLLLHVFSFLSLSEITTTASAVCTSWSDAALTATCSLMCSILNFPDDDELNGEYPSAASSLVLEKGWDDLTRLFPWGRYLSGGASKAVYRVHNKFTNRAEAVSVMDFDTITHTKTILAELLVSWKLSSLTRLGICPNFVTIREVFTCGHPPPSDWGTAEEEAKLGDAFDPGMSYKPPSKPKKSYPGRFVFIRMDLFLKNQTGESVDSLVARSFIFQVAFALHVAGAKFSVKHYDEKLLNVFLHAPEVKRNLVLRYGLGSRTFALNMPPGQAIIAKIADYGTADIRPESNGEPVTAAQFTTIENTPPDFMILGDRAQQGPAHDCFGLGLCMLHLFTGHAPYEEILKSVKCPSNLEKRLRNIWENKNDGNYTVIRSVILSDVEEDEDGNVVSGEPDERVYHTLYRFLVLFGIPDLKFKRKRGPKVWVAIQQLLVEQGEGPDAKTYRKHCKKFSILEGQNFYIKRARKSLESMDGGLELLFELCSFDPSTRATALDVLNSRFMAALVENENSLYDPEDTVHSFTSF